MSFSFSTEDFLLSFNLMTAFSNSEFRVNPLKNFLILNILIIDKNSSKISKQSNVDSIQHDLSFLVAKLFQPLSHSLIIFASDYISLWINPSCRECSNL